MHAFPASHVHLEHLAVLTSFSVLLLSSNQAARSRAGICNLVGAPRKQRSPHDSRCERACTWSPALGNDELRIHARAAVGLAIVAVVARGVERLTEGLTLVSKLAVHRN